LELVEQDSQGILGAVFLHTWLSVFLVWTAFRWVSLNLSEVALGSDSFSGFSTKPV
jgi:hypothetical protein